MLAYSEGMRSIALISLCLTGTTAMALDPCLIGSWEADASKIASSITHPIVPGKELQPYRAAGRIGLEITADGTLTLFPNSAEVEPLLPDIPPMTITVTGQSGGTIETFDGGTYRAVSTNIALIGAFDLQWPMPDDPGKPLDWDWGPSSEGTYTCDQGSLTFVPVDSNFDAITFGRAE